VDRSAHRRAGRAQDPRQASASKPSPHASPSPERRLRVRSPGSSAPPSPTLARVSILRPHRCGHGSFASRLLQQTAKRLSGALAIPSREAFGSATTNPAPLGVNLTSPRRARRGRLYPGSSASMSYPPRAYLKARLDPLPPAARPSELRTPGPRGCRCSRTRCVSSAPPATSPPAGHWSTQRGPGPSTKTSWPVEEISTAGERSELAVLDAYRSRVAPGPRSTACPRVGRWANRSTLRPMSTATAAGCPAVGSPRRCPSRPSAVGIRGDAWRSGRAG
jgi:hypothetical protein